MLLILLSIITLTSADVDYDPFETAAKLNASLHTCYRNHVNEYPDKAENQGSLGSCPYVTYHFNIILYIQRNATRYYFERDARSSYWCRDKSCAISTAIHNRLYDYDTKQCTNPHDSYVAPDENAFFVGSNFITRDKAPEAIPCGLMLFDQSFYGDGEGIACVQGDNWKETERNTDSINWENVDFETPSYQSNACCSSVARMGFRGKYASGSHATKSNIHDPFGNLLTQFGVEIACNVDRKSDSGDTCGNGKSWDDFVGTGVCGINDIYTSENENKVTAWATANGVTIERHPTYCSQESLTAACDMADAWVESYCPDATNQQTGLCDGYDGCGEISLFEVNDIRRKCPYQDNVHPRRMIGGPLSKEEKSECRACHAVAKAFSGFPCSGRQAEFVDKNTKEFRVCLSACEVLFSTCGLPTHRGGMFVTTKFDFSGTEAQVPADYHDATSMCQAMWNPTSLEKSTLEYETNTNARTYRYDESIWAMENFSLVVVDDSVDNHDGCVALERMIADFNYDTQNFIFDYQAIRNGEGYCSTGDPLYNTSSPCFDLEQKVEAARRRLSGVTSEQESGGSMYSRGDISRAKLIDQGWPWEDSDNSTMMIAIIASGAVVSLVIIAIVLYFVCRSSKKVDSGASSGVEMK